LAIFNENTNTGIFYYKKDVILYVMGVKLSLSLYLGMTEEQSKYTSACTLLNNARVKTVLYRWDGSKRME
jgi:hypothetical protein